MNKLHQINKQMSTNYLAIIRHDLSQQKKKSLSMGRNKFHQPTLYIIRSSIVSHFPDIEPKLRVKTLIFFRIFLFVIILIIIYNSKGIINIYMVIQLNHFLVGTAWKIKEVWKIVTIKTFSNHNLFFLLLCIVWWWVNLFVM